jgi:type II secretory pathway component PulF
MSDFFSNASFVIGNNIWWLLLALAIGIFFGYTTCERVDTRRHS